VTPVRGRWLLFLAATLLAAASGSAQPVIQTPREEFELRASVATLLEVVGPARALERERA